MKKLSVQHNEETREFGIEYPEDIMEQLEDDAMKYGEEPLEHAE